MANRICIHCFISGKVQGVWYRANAKEQADALGITGWARNLPDGRVEVLACGKNDDIKKLYEWLKLGPELANVTDITYEEMPWQDLDSFATQ